MSIIKIIEIALIDLCIEWFLYGKIFILCAFTCTLVKEVHLFPGLGLYSGIFATYCGQYFKLQRSRNKSKRASIIFYALCALYVLSTVNAVLDLIAIIIEIVSNCPLARISFLKIQCRTILIIHS